MGPFFVVDATPPVSVKTTFACGTVNRLGCMRADGRHSGRLLDFPLKRCYL